MNNKSRNRLNTPGLCAMFVFLLTLAAPAGAAQQRGSDFDHLRTGFSLRGAHARVECQTCHVQGVFKGTPTQCERCHTQGSRMAESFKPANHVPTGLACDQCHTNTVSWSGARYRHTGVAPGSCLQCHNGSVAPGKSANHMQTNASCDSCHRTTAWIPARVDHSMFAPGSCLQCHANKKPNDPTHAGVTASCDTCHNTRSWAGARFSHTNAVPNGCLACHGSSARGKQAGHIPAPMSCDACHNTTTFSSSTMRNHTVSQGVIVGGCLTCHNGAYTSQGARGKPTEHTPSVVTTCDGSGCHRTSTWSR